MNFFEQQDLSRQKTQRLIFFFYMTVFLTAALSAFSYILFAVYYFPIHSYHSTIPSWNLLTVLSRWDFWVVFGTVVSMVLAVSFIKSLSLKSGGKAVAQMVGAQSVPLQTRDSGLARYVNIVEEMSLASGTPVPHIYYMPNELTINAFAAGHTINNACIVVSQGAIERLTRDELQGVVAHEFGHIFNGDMLMNITLLGHLAGLTCISDIGRVLINISHDNETRNSRRSRNASGISLLGVAIFVIGSVGHFMGLLLKAAISRSRETLADASAVQFTRNPEGLAGALKKILISTPKMTTSRTAEISHFFLHYPPFTLGSLIPLLHTHPPLEERIKLLDPHFHRTLAELKRETTRPQSIGPRETMGLHSAQQSSYVSTARGDKEMAKNLALAFLLYRQEDLRGFELVLQNMPGFRVSSFEHSCSELQGLKPKAWIEKAELLIGHLKELTLPEKEDVLKTLKEIIAIDDKVTREEFLVYELMSLGLKEKKSYSLRARGPGLVQQDVAHLLSLAISTQKISIQGREELLQTSLKTLYPRARASYSSKISLEDMSASVLKMQFVSSSFKQKFVMSMAQIFKSSTVSGDGLLFLSLLSLSLGIPLQAWREFLPEMFE